MNPRRLATALSAVGLVGAVVAVLLAAAQPASAVGGKKCKERMGNLICKLGDRGPGGGIVFYDAGSVQPWGRYLEVAPANWSKGAGDYAPWCPLGAAGHQSILPTQDGFGTGPANTQIIIDACGTDTAAGKAVAYRGGKKSDWYLPAKDELHAIWTYGNRARLGMSSNYYWSSSQFVPGPGGDIGAAWAEYFGSGTQTEGAKDGADNRVRPIRAFK